MFNVKVTYGSGNSFSLSTDIAADRLPDAEHHVSAMLASVFPDIEFVLVHVGDLNYNVYTIDEPIATVHIQTTG